MSRELSYFPFIIVLSLGYFVGLIFPDTDQGFQLLLGHRSIITHSILLPYLLYFYFNKKNNLTPLKTILIVGIYLGIGLHLSADLHPKAFRGYALIKLPFNIDIGGLSPIWIGANAGVAFYLASKYLNELINKKLFWISYLIIGFLVGITYADEEPHNNDAILGTFLFLFLATFIYSKIRNRNSIIQKEVNKKKQVKKQPPKKRKRSFWLYAVGIPSILIIIIIILGNL